LPTSKLISLINNDDEDVVTIFVGVKPRLDNDFEFKFIREDSVAVNHSKLEARAILLPEKDKKAQYDESNLEEYEYDIVWSNLKQLWVTTLYNGTYLINVKAEGFKEINEIGTIS
jgi:hypothetical protein